MNKKLITLFMSVAIITAVGTSARKDFSKHNLTSMPKHSAITQMTNLIKATSLINGDTVNEIKESLEDNLVENLNKNINLQAIRKQKLRKVEKSLSDLTVE